MTTKNKISLLKYELMAGNHSYKLDQNPSAQDIAKALKHFYERDGLAEVMTSKGCLHNDDGYLSFTLKLVVTGRKCVAVMRFPLLRILSRNFDRFSDSVEMPVRNFASKQLLGDFATRILQLMQDFERGGTVANIDFTDSATASKFDREIDNMRVFNDYQVSINRSGLFRNVYLSRVNAEARRILLTGDARTDHRRMKEDGHHPAWKSRYKFEACDRRFGVLDSDIMFPLWSDSGGTERPEQAIRDSIAELAMPGNWHWIGECFKFGRIRDVDGQACIEVDLMHQTRNRGVYDDGNRVMQLLMPVFHTVENHGYRRVIHPRKNCQYDSIPLASGPVGRAVTIDTAVIREIIQRYEADGEVCEEPVKLATDPAYFDDSKIFTLDMDDDLEVNVKDPHAPYYPNQNQTFRVRRHVWNELMGIWSLPGLDWDSR